MRVWIMSKSLADRLGYDPSLRFGACRELAG